MKIGNLVRFAHEQNGGPVHRVVSVMDDGMVEVHDIGGYFAPHLFVAADDIAGIPLDGQAEPSPVEEDWDALAHVRFLRQRGHGSSGYTADLIEHLHEIATESNRVLAAVRKVRDGYADQAKFADIDCAVHFREFVRRLDKACEVK